MSGIGFLLYFIPGLIGFYILYLGLDEKNRFPRIRINTTIILGAIIILAQFIYYFYKDGFILAIGSLFVSWLISLILKRLI